MTIRHMHFLGNKVFRTGGPLAGLLLGWTGAGALCAQAPFSIEAVAYEQPAAAQAPSVPRNYLNKNNIRLPIQINESARGSLQEVQLYIKEHAGSPWVLRDKVAPTQKAFTVQMPHDGEFAFTMVTVDKQGRRTPADLRNEPPGLIVVIDTKKPLIELTNLGQTPEGHLIQFDVRDANVDAARVRFAYQGGDRVFRPLEPLSSRPNVYCIPEQAVFTGLVRASAEDLAGNATMQEEHLSKMPTRNPAVASAPPVVTNPPVQPMPKTPVSVVAPKSLPQSVAQSQEIQRMPAGGDSNLPRRIVQRPDPKDGPRFEPAPVEPTSAALPKMPDLMPPPAPLQQTNHTLLGKRQIVNNTKLFLDYQIENAGPSGVGNVEVWFTRDQAKSWTKLSDVAHTKCPVEVQLPGEGLFGVTLVASNGRGVVGAPPAVGDSPDWWIEVDTTKPSIDISKIATAQENGKHYVLICWTAHDKNLCDDPVDLFYAATPQGPWLPIAKGLKAEGQHRWTPPVEIGPQAHVRLIARDVAGNTTIVNTLAPVSFGDQARPRALIRGISTTAPDSQPVPVLPQGN